MSSRTHTSPIRLLTGKQKQQELNYTEHGVFWFYMKEMMRRLTRISVYCIYFGETGVNINKRFTEWSSLVYGDVTQLLQIVSFSPINRDSLRHVVVVRRVHGQNQLTDGDKQVRHKP